LKDKINFEKTRSTIVNCEMVDVGYYGSENIADLVPKSLPQIYKPKKYQSKHRHWVKDESKDGKLAVRTMGHLKTPLNAPTDFLKKRTRTGTPPNAVQASPFRYPTDRKPEVPGHVVGSSNVPSDKNFITNNAVTNIRSVPRRAIPKYVDTPSGNSRELIPSGLYPKYSQKTNYGKVPEYIVQRKKEASEAQREYDAYIQERMRQGSMKRMPDAERTKILEGLKTNWNLLHHQYQGLSVVMDTQPKRNRKEQIEKEMATLERDIKTIEAHPVIYIH